MSFGLQYPEFGTCGWGYNRVGTILTLNIIALWTLSFGAFILIICLPRIDKRCSPPWHSRHRFISSAFTGVKAPRASTPMMGPNGLTLTIDNWPYTNRRSLQQILKNVIRREDPRCIQKIFGCQIYFLLPSTFSPREITIIMLPSRQLSNKIR